MVRNAEAGTIYVLLRQGNHWSAHADPWRPTDTDTVSDTLAPRRGLGKLWRDNGAVQEALGKALDAEQAGAGLVQPYSGATLLWSGSRVYVLYQDGTWVSG
jgi:hypothetical protein